MKIAILLRGQLKNWKLGNFYFKRNIIEKYSEKHDIRVFLHTWDSEIKDDYYTDCKFKSIHHRWGTEKIEIDDIRARIRSFNPESYHVSSDSEIVTQILHNAKLHWKDTALQDFILSQFKDPENTAKVKSSERNCGISENPISFMYVSPDLYKSYNLDKMAADLHIANYKFGQYYSSFKSHDLYKKYSKENNWQSDLVISTRVDLTHEIADNGNQDPFERIYDFLDYQRNLDFNYQKNIVMSHDQHAIKILKNMPFLNDFSFTMLEKDSHGFFKNEDNDFFKLFLKHRHRYLSYLWDNDNSTHTLWTKFSTNTNFLSGASFDNAFYKGYPVRRDWEGSIDDLFNKTVKEIEKTFKEAKVNITNSGLQIHRVCPYQNKTKSELPQTLECCDINTHEKIIEKYKKFILDHYAHLSEQQLPEYLKRQ